MLKISIYTIVLLVCLSPAIVFAQTDDSAEKDYSAELPRLPALSLEEVTQSFQVLDGFRVELVAAEPLVTDPVAFAFDARGRLFVVEMRDYSEQATEHLGRIALLEDLDGDGRMDRRTTFVENLSWPTAIWPWRDGVLVAEPPRITWYRDTDGDNVSDQSEDWFSGFGRSNVQGMVNSMRWGVDGLIHGATSSTGAEIESLVGGSTTLHLRRRDFAIDPLKKQITAESGGGQHGMSFNRWGDKFVTSNSDHLQQLVDLDSWLTDHPAAVPMPSTRRSIAEDGPQAEVFRASPIEPWRIVRTRLRVSGVTPGIVEGGGRAAGYFTGATGTWIMDRELGFGDSDFDTAIVCDVGSNLVHRKRLIDQGLFWTSQRIDQGTELLRSSDTWFRPVQLGDGPDGALYIADMAREVIEHPKSLPPMIKKHLDLTSGRDRGRIWRLAPTDDTDRVSGKLADFTSSQLVSRLEHRLPWQRRMASQLLVERGDTSIEAELLRLGRSSERAESQVLAMHIAQRLGLFSEQFARSLLSSENNRVLQHAIDLVADAGLAESVLQELLQLADTEDARVQLTLAKLAADLDESIRWKILSPMLNNVTEPVVRAVIATAAGDDSWQMFDRGDSINLADDDSEWLALLLPVWSGVIADNEPLAQWVGSQLVADSSDAAGSAKTIAWLDALCDLPNRHSANKVLDTLAVPHHSRLDDFINQTATTEMRPEKMRWIGLLSEDIQHEWLEKVVVPTSDEALQRTLIVALSWADSPQLAEYLVSEFASMTPGIQRESLRILAMRNGTRLQLAEALETQVIRRSQIPPETRQRLLSDRDPVMAKRFQSLLTAVAADRATIIAKYAEHLKSTKVDTNDAGSKVFVKVCAQCHRVGNVGNDVGPPLQQLAGKSPQQLLEIILDPNREVDPKYASYSILLADGRVLAGIILEESASQIILAEAGGIKHTIHRDDIELLRNTGVSLMPVGLEEQVTPQQMAQLIQFLRSTQ